MNKVKQLLSVLVLSFVLIVSVKAQNVNSGAGNAPSSSKTVKKTKLTNEQRAAALTDTLKNAVGLSEEQYAKAYIANLKFITSKETLKSQGTTDKEAMKAQMKQLSADRRAAFASFLTPEQTQKWQAWKQSRKARLKENHPSPSGKGKGASDNDHLIDENGEM